MTVKNPKDFDVSIWNDEQIVFILLVVLALCAGEFDILFEKLLLMMLTEMLD